MKQSIGIVLIFIVTLFAGSLKAQTTVEKISADGKIDWQKMKISATGIGAPPDHAKTATQASLLAKRAAVVMARRNLMEVVQGVRIDSTTTVKNYIVYNDRVLSTVQGLLKESVVEEVVPQPDGSYQATVSMLLTDRLGLALLSLGKITHTQPLHQKIPAPSAPQYSPQPVISPKVTEIEKRLALIEQRVSKLEQENKRLKNMVTGVVTPPPPLPSPKTAPPAPAAETRKTEIPSYTGLVIDARGTGFKPSLKPEIYGPKGLLYPNESVSFKQAVHRGYVRYYSSIHQAQQSNIVGTLPKTVKAAELYDGQSTLLLPQKDSQLLEDILATTQDNFLTRCKVVIVF